MTSLVKTILPRLGTRIDSLIQRWQQGKLTEGVLAEKIEWEMTMEHARLVNEGASDVWAALNIYAVSIILGRLAFKCEANEQGLPFEIVEYQAVEEAATEMRRDYGIRFARAADMIGKLVARFE